MAMTKRRTQTPTPIMTVTYTVTTTTQLQRLQALSKAAIHYHETTSTGLYTPEDIDRAERLFIAAKNAVSVADLNGE